MITKKQLILALGSVLLLGVSSYGFKALSQSGTASVDAFTFPQISNEFASSPAVSCENGGAYTECIKSEDDGTYIEYIDSGAYAEHTGSENCGEYAEIIGNGNNTNISYEEQFKPYAQFGLTYDSDKNELRYHGKIVRWFEDYYPISADGAQAGNDFFNENGVVDVYAVRDLSNFVRFDDGSFDPSGKLIDVKEFSAEEFAARDIEAIKNPHPITATTGDNPLSAKDIEDIAKEYEPFGVTYDAKEDQWYFNGEKVRYFRNVLTSNGENLTNGKFKGTMRSFGSEDGNIAIQTIRDFTNLNISGNGTLTSVEKISQGSF